MPQRISAKAISRAFHRGVQYDVAGDTLHWDAAQGHVLEAIVDKNCTIAAPTNLVPFANYVLKLHVEGPDVKRITWNSIFEASGLSLDLSNGTVNAITFLYDPVSGKLRINGAITTYEYTYPWSASLDATPHIGTDYAGWRWWKHKRMGQFADHCPLRRSATYYFSQTGDDTTGDGTQARPWKTRAKAATVLGNDVRVRFKRGEVWTESGTLSATANCTIDNYGDSWLDPPLFNRFVRDYSIATWTLAAGNRYTTAETATIRAVREKLDRLGEKRGTHLIRVASSAAVESTPFSWFWGSNVLHVNLNGADPNSVDLEAVEQNSESGILHSPGVDGCRIEGVRADGWGCTGANLGYAFMSIAVNNEANYWKGLEGFYSGTHIMGHLAQGATGGKLYVTGARAGLEIDPTGDGHYIAFANNGQHEVWFDHCEATYGALRTSAWSYATDPSLGVAVAAHTAGAAPQMIVCHGLRVRQGAISSCRTISALDQNDNSSITGFADFANCKCFEVNTLLMSPTSARNCDWGDSRIRYGCRYYHKPVVGGSTFVAIHTQAWGAARRSYFANCLIDLDCASVPNTSWVALTNRAASAGNSFEVHHTMVAYRNVVGGGRSFAWDYSVSNSSPGTGNASTSKAFNCIFSSDSATSFDVLAITNQAANIKNNAYRTIDPSVDEWGYSNDAGAVTLSSQPIFGVDNAQLRNAGTTNVLYSHDINGKCRTAITPDIGPVDFSS